MKFQYWYSSALRQSAERKAELRSQRRQRQGSHALSLSAGDVAHGREDNIALQCPSGFHFAVRCSRIRAARPNPSLERTFSGMPRKPAALHVNYPRTSGLRGTPPVSAHLER